MYSYAKPNGLVHRIDENVPLDEVRT